MKKTIAMTLVALSSMAVGAVPEGTTEEIWKLDFASSGATVTKKDGVTLTNPWPGSTGADSSYTTDGLEIRQSSNIKEVYHFQQTAGKLTFADEFTMVLTLKYDSHNGNYPVLFGLGTDNRNDETNRKGWKATYYVPSGGDPGNCFVLDRDGYGVTQHRGNGGVEVTTGETYTLTLYNSGSYKGADSGRVELYVGDTLASYSVFDNTENLNTLSVEHFSLGGRIYDNNNGSNITVSSAALYKYVPEPTTATLSLLALAGLAARRRRR